MLTIEGGTFRHIALSGLLVGGALLLAAAVAWPTLLFPIGYDQATFLYVARIWEHGGLPFRDALDTKPLGIYALYALADLMFGQRIASFRICEILAVGASILAFRSIFRSLGALRPTQAAGIAFGFFLLFYFVGLEFWARGEAELPIALLSLWFGAVLLKSARSSQLGRRDAIAAGLLLGCVVLLKQNYALLGAAFLYLGHALSRHSARPNRSFVVATAWFTLGGALPFSAFLLYFAAQGALGDLLLGMFVLPYSYARSGSVPAQSLLSYGGTLLYNLPLVAAGVWGLFGWTRARTPEHRLLLVLVVSALLGLALQRKFWTYHMTALLPLAALAIAAGLVAIRERTALSAAAGGSILTVLFVAHGTLLALPLYGPSTTDLTPWPRKVAGGSNFYAGAVAATWRYATDTIDRTTYYGTFYDAYASSAVDLRLGQRIGQLSAAHETVQLFEFRPSVYIYAGRFAPHRFFFGSLLYLVRPRERARLEEEFSRLTYKERRADWIVFGLDGPWLNEEIQRFSPARHGYRLVEGFESPYHPNSPLKRVLLGLFHNEQARPPR